MKTHCSACGNEAKVNRKGHCPRCAERIATNQAADRRIARNLKAGHPKPYDFPTSGYRPCERCGTRGPLVMRDDLNAVCKDGCR